MHAASEWDKIARWGSIYRPDFQSWGMDGDAVADQERVNALLDGKRPDRAQQHRNVRQDPTSPTV